MSAITVSVIGGGTMGTGIAYVFSQSGAEVTVVEPDTARAAAMQASLARAVASGISRGKLDQARGSALLGRIHRVAAIEEMPLGQALAIETVSERYELKCAVLGRIAAREPGLIATNTMHKVADEVEALSGLPLIHIVDITAQALQVAGVRRVGLCLPVLPPAPLR